MTELLCLDCQTKGFKQILARVTDNGAILIMRYRHGTTVITSPSMTIQCGCGYALHYTAGTVISHFEKYNLL